MSKRINFVDLCLSGEALLEEIDDFVDHWHENPQGKELHDYLGMTTDEYSLWVRIPDALAYIIKARHDSKPLFDAIESVSQDMRLAARANEKSKMARLRKWLETRGAIN